MDENPYRSPDTAEAEPKKARLTWKDRVWAAYSGFIAFSCCFFLCMLPFAIASEMNPSGLAPIRRLAERPIIGPFVVFGVLLTPCFVAGVITFYWFLHADERHQKTGAACLIGSGAGIITLYLILAWLFK
ncbi:MAG TPA: hypothetical protein VMY37_04975 [Thermoguttaceae bacterium]|nr:hypothetical protein [Thermoguttaceae bacterium]